MLEGMTSIQFCEWQVMFDRWHMGQSPFDRQDLSTAIVAQTTANVNRKKPLPLKDFFPTFQAAVDAEPVDPVQAAAALRTRMLSYAERSQKKKPHGRNQ